MHCNLRPPEPRQSSPALFTTPCQVWSRWTYILPYYSVFCCWYITLRCKLNLWPCDLDLWPLTVNICSVSPVTWWNSVPIWTQSSNPRRSYCDLNIWPNDLERRVTCCARLWDNSNKFDLQQLIRAWIIAFLCEYVMSRCDLDLWPCDLDLLQHFECHAFKLCTEFELNQIIHGWLIDDLARFRRAILGDRAVLRGAWTQLHQTWREHRAIMTT